MYMGGHWKKNFQFSRSLPPPVIYYIFFKRNAHKIREKQGKEKKQKKPPNAETRIHSHKSASAGQEGNNLILPKFPKIP